MSWFSDGAISVLWNVVGGAATVGLLESYARGRTYLVGRKYRAVFGNDIRSDFHLVYSLLSLKPLDPADRFPYRKAQVLGVGISIEHPVSSCELRAATYLSESIAANRFPSPRLAADLDLSSRLDLSFVAFGGPHSNAKTLDALDCGKALVAMGPASFLLKSTGEPAVKIEAGFDYGLILKTHPPQFPERTWLVCAGLGEWGTSGSAWYLAHKWNEIYAFAQRYDFAIIVRVRPGQDESAEPLFRVR